MPRRPYNRAAREWPIRAPLHPYRGCTVRTVVGCQRRCTLSGNFRSRNFCIVEVLAVAAECVAEHVGDRRMARARRSHGFNRAIEGEGRHHDRIFLPWPYGGED